MSEVTSFYLWRGRLCRIHRNGSGYVSAEAYQHGDLPLIVPAEDLEREATPISEASYRQLIQQAILSHFKGAAGTRADPVIRIWVFGQGTSAPEHDNMRTLLRHERFLIALMREYDITRADLTPPLPSGTFNPARDDPDLQYMIVPSAPIDHQGAGAIRDHIHDALNLFGTMLLPFTGLKHSELIKRHRLVRLLEPEALQ